MIMPQDWFVTINLKDAYFHVPIAPEHRHFLRFAFMGQIFQFMVLPFDLALAPRVFSKFVQAALEPLQRNGMRILPYLDDLLVCATSPQQAINQARHLLDHTAAVGIAVNWEKCKLVPMQTTNFIGLALNSVTMLASPTPERIRSILRAVGHLLILRAFL